MGNDFFSTPYMPFLIGYSFLCKRIRAINYELFYSQGSIVSSSLSLRGGGFYHSVNLLCKSLNSQPLDYRLFGIKDGKFSDHWNDIPLEPLDYLGPRQFRFSPSLVRSLKSFNPHCICSKESGLHPLIILTTFSDDPIHLDHISRGAFAVQNYNKSSLKNALLLLYQNANLNKASCFHALCESNTMIYAGWDQSACCSYT